MQNEIIINAELGETRVALLEDKQFAELHIERDRDKSVVGNVVKGKVSRVLPGMQAAFVDIGLEKAAFLYVGDYFESTLTTGETDGEPTGGRGKSGGGGRGRGRAAPPRIDTVLREGQEIIVQIAKEPIGTKGARITSSISIPGRHLVLTPWSRRVGVSRRIGSDKERRRLREIVERLRPKNLGFIIRTAGDGVREADLEADIRYLATVWAAIQHRHAETTAPAMLYSEHDLPLRVVRDLAGHDTKRIIADSKPLYEHIQSFVDRFVADPKPAVELYEESLPIFERFDLEPQINANLERKVWLKSGGSLVIDKSEALTAIDVNTGRFVGKRDLEETVFKTNLEAVQEVVHQLRFRNLGGLIIIDLIDMESAGNREKVYRALGDALRADKSRTNILKISELGLVEMTRKRTRENLVQTLCEPCSHCEGRSYVLSRESVAFRAIREIRKHLPKLRGRKVAVSVNPHVAAELLAGSKPAMAQLSEDIGHDIEVRARPGMHQEQYELTVLEAGPPTEFELCWLNDVHPDTRAAADKEEKEKKRAEAKKEDGDGDAKRGRRRGRGRTDGDEESDESAAASDSSEAKAVTPSAEPVGALAAAAPAKPKKAIPQGQYERMSLDDDDEIVHDEERKPLGHSNKPVADATPKATASGARPPAGPRSMTEDSDVTGPAKTEAAAEAKPAAKPESRSPGRKPTRVKSDAARAAAIYERLDSETMDFVPAQATADPAPEVAGSPAAPVKKKAAAVRKKAAAVKKKTTAVAGAAPEVAPALKAPVGRAKPAAGAAVKAPAESSEEAVDPAQAVDSEEESSIIPGSD
jgi:ribonuclease G